MITLIGIFFFGFISGIMLNALIDRSFETRMDELEEEIHRLQFPTD